MGAREQAYVSSIPGARNIGEGGETVNFLAPGDTHVIKAFRDREKFKHSARKSEDRADATVLAGEIGLAPPAFRIGNRLIKQKYVDLNSTGLEDALYREDAGAVERILRAQKGFHDRGIYIGDTAVSNLHDPARTGGYITVDATHIGRARGDNGRYVLGDLAQTQWEADYRGRGDLFLRSVGDVYGSRVQKRLSAVRADQRRTGKLHRIKLEPLTGLNVRRAA